VSKVSAPAHGSSTPSAPGAEDALTETGPLPQTTPTLHASASGQPLLDLLLLHRRDIGFVLDSWAL
jgi:hypothetical protein